MESLFKRQKTAKGRVVLMIAGSLVVHGGLVGIGALLVQPEPEKVMVDWYPQEPEGPSPFRTSELPEQAATPETISTATPEAVLPDVQTPPPVQDDLAMAEPSTPTPRLKTAARPVTTARVSVPRASFIAPSIPGGDRSAMTGGSSAPLGAAWVMPHPPYPAAIRRTSLATGSTIVRVITNATGRVSDVVVVRSAGNPLLDAHTMSYVREHWRGPANAAHTTEFVYQAR